EDCVSFHDSIQRAEHLFLFFHVLDDGFNNDVAIGKVALTGRPLDAGPRLFGFFRRDARLVRLLCEFRERFLNPGKALIQKLLFLLQHGYVITRGRADLGNARAHQPTTEYAYFFNLHISPSWKMTLTT